MEHEILVSVDLTGAPVFVGRLWCRIRGGRQSATFEYDADWLEHLGVRPGDKVDVDLLKDRRMQVRAKRKKPVATILGMLARPSTPRRSVEGLNDAAAAGWAREV